MGLPMVDPEHPDWKVSSKLRANVRVLRRNSTDAERILWSELRAGRLNGASFRRQVPIEHYVADFICHAAKLVIELDARGLAALRGVEETGRAALTEMRRLLGAMRNEGAEAELAPHPSLERLDALAAECGRAGLPVTVHVEGEPVRLPPAVDLSAYRIVQEGLTNALKHAHAGHADVTVRYRPDEIELEVRDDGAGAADSDGLGHGLVGIRERVKIYGGEMTAGPVNGGGFVLSTRLPLESELA